MYYVGICDDSIEVCNYIAEAVQNIPDENVKSSIQTCYSGEELCNYLEDGKPLDILFLDIELIELTGIEVGEFIRNRLDDHRMQIIFISGKTSYARELFQVQPTEFLVKPFSDKQVVDVFLLAVRLLQKRSGKFKFQNHKDYYYLPYEEIISFSSEGRQVKISTLEDEYRFYGKLKNILEDLPENFFVIHKSYIVNEDFVKKYTYESVELMNGMTFPISKPYRKSVRTRLLKEM